MLIDFCLPIYNEEKILKNNVLQLLKYLEQQRFSFDLQIIIINNGSTDNSNRICCELASEKINPAPFNKASEHPKGCGIKIENIKQPGKGGAIKTYALKSKADILLYMDIDLAVSLDNIPGLIKPIIQHNYDLVIG